jgi:hypothetical protein
LRAAIGRGQRECENQNKVGRKHPPREQVERMTLSHGELLACNGLSL